MATKAPTAAKEMVLVGSNPTFEEMVPWKFIKAPTATLNS